MGAYLSEPITQKESSDEDGPALVCGASSMQGWRISQEDAHNCILSFDKDTSLFAVYDGHGGSEVALFCSKFLPQYLKDTAAYGRADYEQALKDAFLGVDAVLLKDDVIEQLKVLGGKAGDDDDAMESDSDEDLAELRQEGGMPLEDVLEKYRDGAGMKSRLAKIKAGESSLAGGSGVPLSPCLKGKKDSGGQSAESSDGAGASSAPTSSTSGDSTKKHDHSDNQPDSSSTTVTSSSSSSGADAEASTTTEAASSSSATNGDSENKTNVTTTIAAKSESETEKVYKNGDVGKSDEVKDTPDSSSTVAAGSEACAATAAVGAGGSSSGVSSSGSNEAGAAAGSSSAAAASSHGVENGSSGGAAVASGSSISSTDATNTGERLAKRRADAINQSSLKRNAGEDDDTESDMDDDDDEGDKEYDENTSSFTSEDGGPGAGGDGVEEEDDDDEDEEEEEEDVEEEEEDMDGMVDGFISNMVEEPGKDSGCTAVVALLHGNELYVANAGDSRCVLSRKGEALEMSFDHKPEDTEEFERIKNAGGRVTQDGRVNGGLNLSRAIGDHAYKMNESLAPEKQMISAMPDLQRVTLTDEDEFMVLACDGIWNYMSSNAVVQFVKKRLDQGQEKMSLICEELFDHCLAKDTSGDGTGCDNMTAIIIRFRRPGTGVDREAAPVCEVSLKRPASPDGAGTTAAAAASSSSEVADGGEDGEDGAKVKRLKTAPTTET